MTEYHVTEFSKQRQCLQVGTAFRVLFEDEEDSFRLVVLDGISNILIIKIANNRAFVANTFPDIDKCNAVYAEEELELFHIVSVG